MKLLRKFKITLIMGRYSHNGTCAIAHKDIVSNPDREGFSIDRINTFKAKRNSCFCFRKISSLKIALSVTAFAINGEGFFKVSS